MKQKFIYKGISIVLVLVMAMMLATSSIAIAQNDEMEPGQFIESPQIQTGINYDIPGGPGFVSTSGFAFYPYFANGVLDYLYGYVYNPSSSSQTYIAPVNLPHGATVNKVVIYYIDSVGSDLDVGLYRMPLSGGNELMALVVSSVLGYTWQQTDYVVESVVDLQNYSYFIFVNIPGGNSQNLALSGVRVDYGYPGYLPLISK